CVYCRRSPRPLYRHSFPTRRSSDLAKNPDITLKFLKAWIEGAYLFKAKPELSIGVLKKYVATQDSEVLNAIYEQQKERLSTKPRSEEHTSELQSRFDIVCRLLLEKK